jgi:hypothetical protein
MLVLLVPAATAHADVMKKYRTAYKNRLRQCDTRMNDAHAFYWSAKPAVENDIYSIDVLVNDPALQSQLPALQDIVIETRSTMLGELAPLRDKTYANIAAFRTKAVHWFVTTADRNRFKARLAKLRAGFKQSFEADMDLASALYLLATNADVSGARVSVLESVDRARGAEAALEAALIRLYALL